MLRALSSHIFKVFCKLPSLPCPLGAPADAQGLPFCICCHLYLVHIKDYVVRALLAGLFKARLALGPWDGRIKFKVSVVIRFAVGVFSFLCGDGVFGLARFGALLVRLSGSLGLLYGEALLAYGRRSILFARL